jgi:hypothetical protein
MEKFKDFPPICISKRCMYYTNCSTYYNPHTPPIYDKTKKIAGDYKFFNHFSGWRLFGFYSCAVLSWMGTFCGFIAAYAKSPVSVVFYFVAIVFWYFSLLLYPTRTICEHAHINMEFEDENLSLVLELSVALNLEAYVLWTRDDVASYNRTSKTQLEEYSMIRRWA